MGFSHATLSRIIGITLLLCIGYWVGAEHFQRIPENTELKNIVIPGYAQDGSPKWVIRGQYIRFKGDMIFARNTSVLPDLSTPNKQPNKNFGIEITFFDKQKRTYQLSSPSCDFNTTTRHGNSKSEIVLQSKDITVSGKEYDVWLNEQRIIIHTDVHINLRNLTELSKTFNEEKKEISHEN